MFRSGTQSDPCISSIATSTMILSSNSSVRRSGTPQSISRCSTAHHGDVRAVPRADRIFLPARSPIPCASSSTSEWLACAPSRPSQSSARAASPGESTCSAIPEGSAPSLAGTISRLNYRSFPRTTVIDPAGSVYMPSGVAAIVMFLSSAGVLQYCTRATDPTKGWLMCLASSMTR